MELTGYNHRLLCQLTTVMYVLLGPGIVWNVEIQLYLLSINFYDVVNISLVIACTNDKAI